MFKITNIQCTEEIKHVVFRMDLRGWLACALAIINALWLEINEDPDQ
ncbi:MAG: hypothetical protein ABL903_18725 [Methylococcales bacterium]